MDGSYLARLIGVVRREKHLRQVDLARLAGVTQSVVSRAERGRVDGMTFAVLDKLAKALEIDLRLEARWRGGLGDRLIDRSHAAIVERVTTVLRRAAWEVAVEFTFNHFGERGSVDVLAFHRASRTLLIIEVKSRLTDLQAFLASFDRKFRIVPERARMELGWDAVAIGRILAVAGTTANRNIVRRHHAIFEASLPARTPDVLRWIGLPGDAIAGVWFVAPPATPTSSTVARVRPTRSM